MKLNYDDIDISQVTYLEELGPIVIKDAYGYRPYSFKAFDVIIDIGANAGTNSLFTRMLFPHADIYTFEPNPVGYASCVKLRTLFGKRLTKLGGGKWEVYNLGIGDGNPVYLHTEQEGNTRSGIFENYQRGEKPALGGVFVPTANSDYTGDVLETITFSDLTKLIDLDLSKNISLKIDCECCESWLYTPENIEILQNFRHIAGEIHFPMGIYEDDASPVAFDTCPICVSREEHKEALAAIAGDFLELHYHSYYAPRGIEHFNLTRKEDNIEPDHNTRWWNTQP